MQGSFVSIRNVDMFYGEKQALFGINIEIKKESVNAFIGPSGCGKSSMLRCINRMNDDVVGFRMDGKILINDIDIYSKSVNPVVLRRHIGMVFQKPNPFPKSIYDNIAYGIRIHEIAKTKAQMDDMVIDALDKAGILKETQNRLHENALTLSGGQQQRLCIARAIAIKPKIILMDEPCSALDPIATAKIEELIDELKEKFTIIIVTHSMRQAARVSDMTAFFNEGRLIEFGETQKIFTNPSSELTQDYITGRFG